jgi:multicomponent Na+:H+ antiporter subunit B
MHWELEITLFIFLILMAYISVKVKNLITAVVTLSVFSFFSALIYAVMGAVDVGFTEAVVGAGVTGVLLIVAILKTYRREERPKKFRMRLPISAVNVIVMTLFLGLMIYAAAGLPARGNAHSRLNQEESPAGSPNAGTYYIHHAHEDAHTDNMVTVILADYRGFDTLGEETVIMTAGLICLLILRKKRKQDG